MEKSGNTFWERKKEIETLLMETEIKIEITTIEQIYLSTSHLLFNVIPKQKKERKN